MYSIKKLRTSDKIHHERYKDNVDTLSSAEIKRELTNMLRDLTEFFSSNGITYSLAYGTLLGAVRHHGFIPWDDDIDIFVTREMYNKILGLKGQLAGTPYDFICAEDDSGDYPFIKFVTNRIEVRQIAVSERIRQYLWIDIFPLDCVPEDAKKAEKMYRKSRRKRLMVQSALIDRKARAEKSFPIFVKKALHPLFRLIGAPRLSRLISRYAQGYNRVGSRMRGCVAWGDNTGEILSAADFAETLDLEFEGMMLKAVKCWDRHLTGIYGDYMQLPPESERASHELLAWRTDPSVDAAEQKCGCAK